MEKEEKTVKQMSEYCLAFYDYIQAGDGEKALEISWNITTCYEILVKQGVDCFYFLNRLYFSDTKTYLVILSVLFFFLKDENILNRAEDLLLKGDMDFFVTMALYYNYVYFRFADSNLDTEYARKRNIHGRLLERYKNECSCAVRAIPTAQKVKNRILLMTNSLLEDEHAPTQMVLDTYCTLRYSMGLDVWLLECIETDSCIPVGEYWLQPYVNRYEKRHGSFSRIYRSREVKGEQIILDREWNQLRQFVEKLWEYKPEGILYIGGENFTVDFLSEIVPVAVMPCTMGYPVSEAQILVSDTPEDFNGMREDKALVESFGQDTLSVSDMLFISKEKNGGLVQKRYRPEDYGCGGEDFLIGIAGNRLEEEIGEEFIKLMEEIVEKDSSCRFVIIGKFEKPVYNKRVESRMIRMGYCKNYADVIGGTHLFLNPVRKGGGGCAMVSVLAGVPVITLGGCDVAAIVGNQFICGDIQEIPDLVFKYHHDEVFYHGQQEGCKKIREHFHDVDDKEAAGKILEAIRGQTLSGGISRGTGQD